MRRVKWRLRIGSGIVDRGPEAGQAAEPAAGAGVVAEDAGTTGADTVGMVATVVAAEAVVKKFSDQDSQSRGARRGFFVFWTPKR
jgi:uridylate kinase